MKPGGLEVILAATSPRSSSRSNLGSPSRDAPPQGENPANPGSTWMGRNAARADTPFAGSPPKAHELSSTSSEDPGAASHGADGAEQPSGSSHSLQPNRAKSTELRTNLLRCGWSL